MCYNGRFFSILKRLFSGAFALQTCLLKESVVKCGHMVLENSETIPEAELKELRAMIEKASWRDTVRYPKHMQHAYVLRKDNPALCGALRRCIDNYGFDMEFYGTVYRYVLIDEFKYWAFDILVNREHIDLSKARP